MKMKTANYTIVLQPEDGGGYTVTVPALPGCITFGKNVLEAQEMALDAIGAYVASLRKHRERVPSEKGHLITSVGVKLPA